MSYARVCYILAFIYIAIALVPIVLARQGVRIDGQSVGDWLFETFAHQRWNVWDGEWWRVITSTFLHAGFDGNHWWVGGLHLGFNVFGLIYVGRLVERWLGPWRFLAYYFLCALAGALVFQIFSEPPSSGVGASGGIFGLIGMLFVGVFSARGNRGVVLGARFWIAITIAIALLVGEGLAGSLFFHGMGAGGVQVAISAHFGGFACGCILGYLMFLPRTEATRVPRRRARWLLAVYVGGIFVYGLLFPYFEWDWWMQKGANAANVDVRQHLLERARRLGGDQAGAGIILMAVEKGDLEEALRYWTEQPIERVELRLEVGYLFLYDALAADDRDAESDAVLDDLIELSDELLRTDRSAKNLNDAAWYRALRLRDLDTAERYAQEAYSLTPDSSHVVNTLGWVKCQRGDYEEGIRRLEDAARQRGLGANFLYLALAHLQNGNKGAARQAAMLASSAPDLLKHERRLLEQIEASLDSG